MQEARHGRTISRLAVTGVFAVDGMMNQRSSAWNELFVPLKRPTSKPIAYPPSDQTNRPNQRALSFHHTVSNQKDEEVAKARVRRLLRQPNSQKGVFET